MCGCKKSSVILDGEVDEEGVEPQGEGSGLDEQALVVDALVDGRVGGEEIKKGIWGRLEEVGGGGCHIDKRSLRVVAAFEEDGEGEGGFFSLTELEEVG